MLLVLASFAHTPGPCADLPPASNLKAENAETDSRGSAQENSIPDSGEAADDYPAAIMVGNAIYQMSSPTPVEMDEPSVLDYTASYTDGWPARDGETNFSRKLALPYAEWEGGIAVLSDHEWCLFTIPE